MKVMILFMKFGKESIGILMILITVFAIQVLIKTVVIRIIKAILKQIK